MELEVQVSTLVYTAFSFLIPFGIYKINLLLHEKGDPGWKRQDKSAKQPK